MVRRISSAPATPADYALAEGPVWDGRGERLLWVDIPAGAVIVGELEAARIRERERITLGGTVGAVALAEDGGLLVAVDAVELPGNAVVREEKRILGSFAYAPDEFAAAVELARELDFGWTTAVPLVDAERVFYALAEGDRTIAKAVITMDSEER